jgi:NADH:ubiquinone oxidoreductase subunit H
LFYLGEYFHLFFFSMVISIMFLGSWEFTRIYLVFSNVYTLI